MGRIAPETGATWSAATVCWSTATSATVQVMSHCSMVRAASACAAAQYRRSPIVFDVAFFAVGRSRPTQRRLLEKLFQKRHLRYRPVQKSFAGFETLLHLFHLSVLAYQIS